jgi:hypothetical protein
MSDDAPSVLEPGINIHSNGDAKVRVAQAAGANEVEPGVIALSVALIARLYEASQARKLGA